MAGVPKLLWPSLEPHPPEYRIVRPQALSTTQQQIQAFINSISLLPVNPAVPPFPTGNPVAVSQVINGVQFSGQDTPMSETINFSEIVSQNADAMWPSCLVQTAPLANGDLAPIGVLRGPATLTLTTPSYNNSQTSVTVPQATLANVQQAILNMAASVLPNPNTPAELQSESVFADSLEQGMIDLGVNVAFVQDSIKAQFNMNVSRETNSIMVKLTQVYYTVAFNTPTSSDAVFDSSVTVDSLGPYMGHGNPPAYVATVTYGRTLLFVFQATVSKMELKAAVDALITGGQVNVDVATSGQYASTLQQTQIQVWAVGGSAVAALSLSDPTNGPAQLQQVIMNGANFSASSPALPISCQVRYLRDNTAVPLSSTSYWTNRSALTAPPVTASYPVGLGRSYGYQYGGPELIVLPNDHVSVTASGTVWSGVWLTGSNPPTGWYTWARPGQSGFPVMWWHPFSLIGQLNGLYFIIGYGADFIHGDANSSAQYFNHDNYTGGDPPSPG